jgi:hypothetical protein
MYAILGMPRARRAPIRDVFDVRPALPRPCVPLALPGADAFSERFGNDNKAAPFLLSLCYDPAAIDNTTGGGGGVTDGTTTIWLANK